MPSPLHLIATPYYFEVQAQLDTQTEAEAFVALFPKSCRLTAGTLGFVTGRAKLAQDGANGGRNEAGVKRYRAIVKAAEAAGVEISYSAPFANSYPSQAAFEAALAG